MKLTKTEINRVRNIFKEYTGKDLSDDITETVFLDFVRLISLLIKNKKND